MAIGGPPAQRPTGVRGSPTAPSQTGRLLQSRPSCTMAPGVVVGILHVDTNKPWLHFLVRARREEGKGSDLTRPRRWPAAPSLCRPAAVPKEDAWAPSSSGSGHCGSGGLSPVCWSCAVPAAAVATVAAVGCLLSAGPTGLLPLCPDLVSQHEVGNEAQGDEEDAQNNEVQVELGVLHVQLAQDGLRLLEVARLVDVAV